MSERAGATKKTSLSVRQNTTGAPIPLSPLVHLRITRSTRIYIEHLNIVVIIIIIIVVAIPPPLSSSTRLSQAYLNLLSSSWTPPPLVRTGLNLGTDSLFTYKHSGRLPVLVLVLVVICNSYPPPSLSCPPSHFKKHRICIEHVNIIIIIIAIPPPSLSLYLQISHKLKLA